MVHFPGFARARLWIHRAVRGVYPRGFPHSEIPGSMPACGSPRLIAACHVLHRLLLPRHPPCALSSLTIKFTQHMPTLFAGSFALSAEPSAAPREFYDPRRLLIAAGRSRAQPHQQTSRQLINLLSLVDNPIYSVV